MEFNSQTQTIPGHNNRLKKNPWKKLWVKEKMLVTGIFSFSHNIFCLIKDKVETYGKVFIVSSANAFSLVKSKISSFSKRLTRLHWLMRALYQAKHCMMRSLNPSPDMPILGSSNSAGNKDMTAKIWTKGDTIICLSRKALWEKEKLLVTSNFSFSHNVFKRSLLLMC